jgi:hypothetical protein
MTREQEQRRIAGRLRHFGLIEEAEMVERGEYVRAAAAMREIEGSASSTAVYLEALNVRLS